MLNLTLASRQGDKARAMADTKQCPDCADEGQGALPLDNFYTYPNGTPFKYCKRHYTKRQNERRAKKLESPEMKEQLNADRRESDKRYRETHKTRRTESMRKWRANNPGKDYEHTRKWVQANPEIARLRQIKNYLRNRAASGTEMRNLKHDAKVCADYVGQSIQILADESPPRQVWALAENGARILVPVDEIIYP